MTSHNSLPPSSYDYLVWIVPYYSRGSLFAWYGYRRPKECNVQWFTALLTCYLGFYICTCTSTCAIAGGLFAWYGYRWSAMCNSLRLFWLDIEILGFTFVPVQVKWLWSGTWHKGCSVFVPYFTFYPSNPGSQFFCPNIYWPKFTKSKLKVKVCVGGPMISDMLRIGYEATLISFTSLS